MKKTRCTKTEKYKIQTPGDAQDLSNKGYYYLPDTEYIKMSKVISYNGSLKNIENKALRTASLSYISIMYQRIVG